MHTLLALFVFRILLFSLHIVIIVFFLFLVFCYFSFFNYALLDSLFIVFRKFCSPSEPFFFLFFLSPEPLFMFCIYHNAIIRVLDHAALHGRNCIVLRVI